MGEQALAYRSGAPGLYVWRVGQRIKVHRMRRRWSQRDLARVIGYSQKSVDNWEDGVVMPRVDAQFALAAAFGVEPDDLFSFGHLHENEAI